MTPSERRDERVERLKYLIRRAEEKALRRGDRTEGVRRAKATQPLAWRVACARARVSRAGDARGTPGRGTPGGRPVDARWTPGGRPGEDRVAPFAAPRNSVT